MEKGQFVAGWFTPVSGPGLPPLPDWGKPSLPWEPGPEHPGHPLPPLPPGVVDPPIEPEPGEPTHPITLPGSPEHPITLPPGFVWPPFDPSDALQGKVVLLCWIPGVSKPRWVVVDLPEFTLPTPPAGGIGGTPPPRPGGGR